MKRRSVMFSYPPTRVMKESTNITDEMIEEPNPDFHTKYPRRTNSTVRGPLVHNGEDVNVTTGAKIRPFLLDHWMLESRVLVGHFRATKLISLCHRPNK